MSNVPIKSIKFPGLSDTYTFTQLDSTLSVAGKAADAKKTGDEITDLKEDLDDVIDVTGQEKTITPTFTDGRSVNANTGGTNAGTTYAYSDGISCKGFDSLRITMPLYATSNTTRGLAFYENFPISSQTSNFISGVLAHYDTSLSTDSSEVREIEIPNGANYFRTTWYASSTEQYATEFVCQLINEGTLDGDLANLEKKTQVTSENVLNQDTISYNTFITLTGTVQSNNSYCATDYIAVNEGDEIVLAFSANTTPSEMRCVTVYDANKVAISASGAENVTSYTVPSGISFVRISANKQILENTTARISLNGSVIPFQTYYSGDVNGLTKQNYSDIELYNHYPLSALPEYFLNNLAYKPMGQLSKGYLCLISDDGNAELATYTIPMLISKGVPCTFAVMKSSAVFQTQAGIDAVVDAVNNHGCNIAQHGVTTWDRYDEFTFNNFLDDEKAYWDSLGLTPYGAVCPQHQINNMVKVVAGGRFGCLRSGYNFGTVPYANYTNGARSNLYALASQSSIDGTVATQSAVLDACMQNHWLRILHWHEYELDTDAKARLEAIIDYALQIGMTFITMKDIPTIV